MVEEEAGGGFGPGGKCVSEGGQFKVGKTEQERSSPWHLELASRSKLGLGVVLWNINDFTENQHQTRPLCDQKRTKQKHSHSVIVSEYSQSMNTGQVRKYQKAWKIPKSPDYCFFLNYSFNFALVYLPFG